MAKWLNRVVVGSLGTGSPTETYNPNSGTVLAGSAFVPTAGRLLVAIIAGPVTSTTPSGWSLHGGASAVNNNGLYMFYKATAAGSDTLTTTHNGDGTWPTVVELLEFPAGSTFVDANSSTGASSSGGASPVVSGLTGTNLHLFALAYPNSTAGWTWTGATEDADVAMGSSAPKLIELTTAYNEDSTASSTGTVTAARDAAHPFPTERVTFVINVATGGGPPPELSRTAGLGVAGLLSATRARAGHSRAGALTVSGALSAARVQVFGPRLRLLDSSSVQGPPISRAVSFSGTGTLSAVATKVDAPPATGLLYRIKGDHLTGADTTTISAWPDYSGNGHPNAVQATVGNRPIVQANALNGHKGAVFNGTTNRLTLSGSALGIFRNRGQAQIFAVYKTNLLTSTRVIAAWGTGTVLTSSRMALYSSPSYTAVGRRTDADNASTLNGSPATDDGQFEYESARFNWANSDLTLLRNGVQQAFNPNFQTNGNTSDTDSLSAVIGGTPGQASFFSGVLVELLIYDGDLSATRSGVYAYFQREYGIGIGASRTASLTNGNTLTAAIKKAYQRTADFAQAGSLTAAIKKVSVRAVSFAAQGLLTAVRTKVYARSAALGTAGTLAAVRSFVRSKLASFGTTGTLSAVVIRRQEEHRTAALGTTGTLSATAVKVPSLQRAASFTLTSTLSADIALPDWNVVVGPVYRTAPVRISQAEQARERAGQAQRSITAVGQGRF